MPGRAVTHSESASPHHLYRSTGHLGVMRTGQTPLGPAGLLRIIAILIGITSAIRTFIVFGDSSDKAVNSRITIHRGARPHYRFDDPPSKLLMAVRIDSR